MYTKSMSGSSENRSESTSAGFLSFKNTYHVSYRMSSWSTEPVYSSANKKYFMYLFTKAKQRARSHSRLCSFICYFMWPIIYPVDWNGSLEGVLDNQVIMY